MKSADAAASSGSEVPVNSFWSYASQLRESVTLCDIQLTVNDDNGQFVSLPAHKLVLAAGSTYFRSCLDKGDLLDVYSFDGISLSNLRMMLDYLYRQVSWTQIQANKEAVLAAGVLGIVHHHTAGMEPVIEDNDGQKVLLVRRFDKQRRQGDTLKPRPSQRKPRMLLSKAEIAKLVVNGNNGRYNKMAKVAATIKPEVIAPVEEVNQCNKDEINTENTQENTLETALLAAQQGNMEMILFDDSKGTIEQLKGLSQEQIDFMTSVTDASRVSSEELYQSEQEAMSESHCYDEKMEKENLLRLKLEVGEIYVTDKSAVKDQRTLRRDEDTDVQPADEDVPVVAMSVQELDRECTQAVVRKKQDIDETDEASATVKSDNKSSCTVAPENNGNRPAIEEDKEKDGSENNEAGMMLESPSSNLQQVDDPGSSGISAEDENKIGSSNANPLSVLKKELQQQSIASSSCAGGTPVKINQLSRGRGPGRPKKVQNNKGGGTPASGSMPKGLYICSWCGRSFKNMTGQRNHENWVHRGMRERAGSAPERCEICHLVFRSYPALRNHETRKHGLAREWDCDSCGAKFPRQVALRQHQIREHQRNLFECEQCKATFKSREGWKIHLYKHSNASGNHMCDLCGKVFRMVHELRTHVKLTHSTSRDFHCQLCTRAFKNNVSLTRHLRTYHSTERDHECDVCKSRYKTQQDMLKHRARHFRDQDPLDSDGRRTKKHPDGLEYPCGFCGKIFKKHYLAVAHENLQHRQKAEGVRFVCTICDKAFAIKHYLMQHINNKHRPRHLTCSAGCGREFAQPYELRKHEQAGRCSTGGTAGTKPYRCCYCGHGFTLKGNLTKHLQGSGRCVRSVQRKQVVDYVVMVDNTEVTEQQANDLETAEALQLLQADGHNVDGQAATSFQTIQVVGDGSEVQMVETVEEQPVVLTEDQVTQLEAGENIVIEIVPVDEGMELAEDEEDVGVEREEVV